MEERNPDILASHEVKVPNGNETIWDDELLSTSIFTLYDYSSRNYTDFKTGPAIGDQHLTS